MKTRKIVKGCPYLGDGWFVQFWSDVQQGWLDMHGPCSAVQANQYEKCVHADAEKNRSIPLTVSIDTV